MYIKEGQMLKLRYFLALEFQVAGGGSSFGFGACCTLEWRSSFLLSSAKA